MKKLLFIAMLMATGGAQADVFKCSDEKGRSVYQERPCETAKLKAVGTVKKPSAAPLEEQQRMMAVAEKSKARFDASMDARGKEEAADQQKREAAYARGIDARKASALERQASAAEEEAKKPAVIIVR